MKDRQLSGTASDDDVLSNYLHSHIVAAASGVRLFERAARVWKDSPHGTTLDRLRADVAADKAELESMAHQLGLSLPPSKRALAWTGSQLARVNPMNPLHSRGSVAGQLELEALETAVTGKSLLWETLLLLSADDSRLDPGRLERLRARAQDQLSRVDTILRATVPERFRTGPR